MQLYNSLTRQIEDFVPIEGKKVGMYTCGPTVYNYPTIGNWRTYILGDVLLRALKYLGYEINYVMNVTDVGHLTGDNLGDADTGEDRMEKASRREGKNAWEIARFYTEDFVDGLEKLNMLNPKIVKATDHIAEQIDLVKKIETNKFAYIISDGVYFDVLAYEQAGFTYGEISTLDQIKEGARVERNPEKRDPRDFALWKFSPTDKQRDMEWDSPWGKGFPGWHIECSAMSMKYLGEQFDIHVGGEDLKSTHHPNEIAQSESATGTKPFVKYWVHGVFLLVDGGRMGKSLGNAYNLSDIITRGFDPLALRYLFLTAHYRRQLNFTWESLEGAAKALDRLRKLIGDFKIQTHPTLSLSKERENSPSYFKRGLGGVKRDDGQVSVWQQKFIGRISDDLDMPGALAVVWETVKDSTLAPEDKQDLLLGWDQVLGLQLSVVRSQLSVVDNNIQDLVNRREQFRRDKSWAEADAVRVELERLGYLVEDTAEGVRVKKQSGG